MYFAINYSYALANDITSLTEGRGITATMTYDELERVKTKSYHFPYQLNLGSHELQSVINIQQLIENIIADFKIDISATDQ